MYTMYDMYIYIYKEREREQTVPRDCTRILSADFAGNNLDIIQ